MTQLVGEYRTIAAASKPGDEAIREHMLAVAKSGQSIRVAPIVGLVRAPTWPTTPEYTAALTELRGKIEARAREALHRSVADDEPWTKALDPKRPAAALTIAAYRDLCAITSDDPLGPALTDPAQRLDHARAAQALTPSRQSPQAPSEFNRRPTPRRDDPTRRL